MKLTIELEQADIDQLDAIAKDAGPDCEAKHAAAALLHMAIVRHREVLT